MRSSDPFTGSSWRAKEGQRGIICLTRRKVNSYDLTHTDSHSGGPQLEEQQWRIKDQASDCAAQLDFNICGQYLHFLTEILIDYIKA